MFKKGNKKVINGWAFYDWANSAYPLVITTAIFPIFYNAVTTTEATDGTTNQMVTFFGFEFINTALYSYTFSLSFLIVSLISPLLSGVADYAGNKKDFLKFFCYLGATSCGALYFFNTEYLELSMLAVLLASIGFWGSIVFYNAYLPAIAEPEDHDRVSAKGFSLGYLGSSILLIANLIAIQGFEMPAKYSFLTVAIWWAGFAQFTYARLPADVFEIRTDAENKFKYGFNELRKVWAELGKLPQLKKYLRAFFVYSMGVQTVMLLAVLFADKEIEWGDGGSAGLIISVLIIQFIAIIGAFVFSRLSSKIGNIPVLKIAVVIWVGVCITAYFITQPVEFYILAAVVGFVMGGIQSLSRSTYSKILPETKDHASYFSFYDVLEKLGIVIGTFAFGFIEEFTGSMRDSTLALMVFFIVGFVLLMFVPRVGAKTVD